MSSTLFSTRNNPFHKVHTIYGNVFWASFFLNSTLISQKSITIVNRREKFLAFHKTRKSSHTCQTSEHQSSNELERFRPDLIIHRVVFFRFEQKSKGNLKWEKSQRTDKKAFWVACYSEFIRKTCKLCTYCKWHQEMCLDSPRRSENINIVYHSFSESVSHFPKPRKKPFLP